MTSRPKIIVALVLSFVAGPALLRAADMPSKDIRQVSVQGTAKLQAEPDIARIWVEVTDEGAQADDVTARVRTKMGAVLTAVKNQGVSEKDIQTKQYQVAPKIRWANGRSTREGYTVTNQVEVKIRDLKKAGLILSAATDAGANSVNGPQFDIENPKILERKALGLAMEDAKARASALADAAGASLGSVLQISESGGFMPGPRPLMMRLAAASREAASAPEPIESGQQEISATVNVTFSLR